MRWRVAVAVADAVIAASVLGVVTAVWSARRARVETRRAEKVQQFLVGLFAGVGPVGVEVPAHVVKGILA